ncbi:MAG: phosphoribosylanthranilate isomerase [Bryobacteraceae bacterium]
MQRPADPPFIVKICGIANEEDARVAVDAGANALGFNFYRQSPRYIDPECAREILERVPGRFLRVAVFVNPSPGELAAIAAQLACDVVQLHGEVCPREVPRPYRVWRSLAAFSTPPARDNAIEAYLLDAPSDGFGGSGKAIDWKLAASFPYRKIVAGGLDASNVAAAIETATPDGVDACSRLELRPGKKDVRRVRDFVREALSAARALAAEKTL